MVNGQYKSKTWLEYDSNDDNDDVDNSRFIVIKGALIFYGNVFFCWNKNNKIYGQANGAVYAAVVLFLIRP